MEQMDITSAQYWFSQIEGVNTGIVVIIDGQELSVPFDPANRHYAEIMRQVEAGELTIQEASD